MNFNTANNTFRQLMGNELLYQVPPFQPDYSWSIDEWDDLWQDILGLLGSDSFPEFLRVFWNSDHKLVRKTYLFETIRQAVSDRGQAFALILDLDRHAPIYGALALFPV